MLLNSKKFNQVNFFLANKREVNLNGSYVDNSND